MGCSNVKGQGVNEHGSSGENKKNEQDGGKERGEDRNTGVGHPGNAVNPGDTTDSEPLVISEEARDREKYPEEEDEPRLDEEEEEDHIDLEIEEKEKDIEECSGGKQYIDTDFDAENSSLFYSRNFASLSRVAVWKRPRELVGRGEKACLVVGESSRKDLQQGELGDCWFLSAVVAVAQYPQLIKKVIPNGNQILSGDDSGKVEFRFWRFGEWKTVEVDDRIPVRKNGQFLFAHSLDPTEFWPQLIEKAYAKEHGSYEALVGGHAMDAMVDLTGGVAERLDFSDVENRDENFSRLLRASTTNALITTSVKGSFTNNKVNKNGLVSGHAYTVTKVAQIEELDNTKLIRVRNPWADRTEWTGAWNDDDPRWAMLDNKTKTEIEFEKKKDGEFWMTFSQFLQNFAEVTICTIGADLDGDGDTDTYSGQIQTIHGGWHGETAGGCRNDMKAFSKNPQYFLKLNEPDHNDNNGIPLCNVVISLMQEDRRKNRHLGVPMLHIGFVIYAVPKNHEDGKVLPGEAFFGRVRETGSSGPFMNIRSITSRFELEPGGYVIVPSTFKAGDEADFCIRVAAANSIRLLMCK